MIKNKILQGDALDVLKTLPEKSINMLMTSPPYWALRDYGVEGQLGLEPTFEEYINNLCNIFDEVKRVLRDDGTCWVNIGDTYSGNGKGAWKNKDKQKESYVPENKPKINETLSPKSMCGIPFRFALEMINRGWILRNTIIWHKNNCMPSSVKDRFTVDFEYLFFFSKKKKYYFEQQLEPNKTSNNHLEFINKKFKGKENNIRINHGGKRNPDYLNPLGRNKRTTWTINPKPFKEAHFAVYPEELCVTPINAGCPNQGIVLDPFFGAGTTGLVALKQNKNFLGIELNEDYIKIAEKRLKPFMEQGNSDDF